MPSYSFAEELKRFGPQAPAADPPTIAEARRYCRELAGRHYENFTVASRLLPRPLRQHFCHVYAYCRWADDLADETGSGPTGLALLAWWEGQLRAHYLGQSTHPVFVALAETNRQFAIPIDPYLDLLVAFRQDQHVTRYETFDQLIDYCRNSANPVGRLVLCLGECNTPERVHLSDSICTGLQLANFCQDVANDWQRGRIYLAQEDCRRFGVDETVFARGQTGDAFERLMTFYCDRAEGYLRGGWPLVAMLPKALRLSVAAFVRGGLAIVEAIRRQRYDVWTTRPRVATIHKLWIVARCWWQLQLLRVGLEMSSGRPAGGR